MTNRTIRRNPRFSLKLRKLVFEQLASRTMLAADIAAHFAPIVDRLPEAPHNALLELGSTRPGALSLQDGDSRLVQANLASGSNANAVRISLGSEGDSMAWGTQYSTIGEGEFPPMGPYLGTGTGTGTGTGSPEDPGMVKECTLRAAIDQANETTGYNTIAVGPHSAGFSVDPIIPALKAAGQADYSVNSEGNDGDLDSSDMICWTGNYVPRDLAVSTITPEKDPLPDIVDPVSIQGAVDGQSRSPKTEIDGKSVTGSGFKILASGSAISGLAIHSFSENGIEILSNNNLINSNFIGTDRTGNIALPNVIGVKISSNGTKLGAMIGDWPNADASNQVVPLEGFNVISGNTSHGVEISGAINVVSQNYIGTNRHGDSALGNGGNGVEIKSSAGANFVGGGASGLSPTHDNAGINVISGNAGEGVHIGDGNSGSWIEGVLIGTDWSGLAPIPNGKNGVAVDASSGVKIRLNTISGNTQNGVVLKGATNAIVRENMIGINKPGNAALTLQKDGILLSDGAFGAQIHENVISGNELNGVHITGNDSSRSWIWGNKIGVNKTAGVPVKNNEEGILIEGRSVDHVIGVDGFSNAPGGGNVISGNGKNGINLTDGKGTRIQGNVIGTDGTRTVPLPNMYNGIHIDGVVSEVLIGVDEITPAGQPGIPIKEQNFIAANKKSGIFIGDSVSKVVVTGNTIGLKVDSNNLGNGDNGITVIGDQNQIGSDGDNILDTREWNAIEANGKDGILLSVGSRNIVAGNLIAYNANNGVALEDGAYNNIIGYDGISPNYAATRNTISQNSWNGVSINGPRTRFNIVAGNYIGLDPSGSQESPNALDGVLIQGEANRNVIGTDGDTVGDNWEGNFISGNARSGVRIKEPNTTMNRVAGNTIGLTITETVKGNGESGVVIENALKNFVGISGATGSANEPNVISGNLRNGVWMLGRYSNGNTVAGNFIGTNKAGTLARPNLTGLRISDSASHNVVGKGNVISGNSNDGVVLEGKDSIYNQVINNLIGTDAPGIADLGNLSYGVVIDGARHSVLDGNYISGNDLSGVRITNFAKDNELINNQIGVTKKLPLFPLGKRKFPLGNGSPTVVGHGVLIDGFSQGNQIGRVGQGNTIGGNFGNGVRITDSSYNSLIGNEIGIEVRDDMFLLSFIQNASHGIQVTNGDGNSIGGIKASEGNTIAFNKGDGVWIESGLDNPILGNSIFENDELGIDLGINGVTSNDFNDTDSGANNLQNFPMLEKDSSASLIKGILISEKELVGSDKKYRIEVFGSDVADPSGHGEGKQFVGAITVQWQDEGSALFSLTPTVWYSFYSATATEIIGTDSSGNYKFGSTSEFGPKNWVTKVDFLDKNSSKTTYANVSKWENAFSKLGTPGTAEIPGPPSAPEVKATPVADPDFYKTDADRIYVRIEDTARRGFGTIQSNLNTIDLQNALADKVEQFDLIESPANSGLFLSEPFVFVSNKFDDNFLAAGVRDGNKKDPTLNVFNPQKVYSSPLDILLGGNIKALYDKQTGTGPTPTSNPLGLVDSKIDIGKDIKEVTLTTHLISGSGATPDEVKKDFAAMNIAWAQGNIRVRPYDPNIPIEAQPTGVDLTDFLDATKDANGVVPETAEQRSLKAGQSSSWSVIDYYVINDFTDRNIEALTSYSENVIITKKASLGNFRASAHELGHALGSLGHTKAYTIDGRVNVMYPYPEAVDSVNAAKRLTEDQIKNARSHWAVKSPLTPNVPSNNLTNQPPATLTSGQIEPVKSAAIVDSKRVDQVPEMFQAVYVADSTFVQTKFGLVELETAELLAIGSNAISPSFDRAGSGNPSLIPFSSAPHALPDKPRLTKTVSTQHSDGLDDLTLLDQYFLELAKETIFAS